MACHSHGASVSAQESQALMRQSFVPLPSLESLWGEGGGAAAIDCVYSGQGQLTG